MTLLCLDVDHFKSFNDTYAHDLGDQVLVVLSKVMQGRIRATDYVFRLGGEEFLILLHGCTELVALVVAEEIRIQCEQRCSLEERTVTVSIGVATTCCDETWDNWLKRSDQYLYQGKRTGRNRVATQSDCDNSELSVLSVIRSDVEFCPPIATPTLKVLL